MDHAEEVAALREELAALRRRGRTALAVALAALALALAACGLLAWRGKALPAGEGVEAQEYRLIDPDGRLRGMWHCPPAGPSLTLLDEEGRALVVLREGPDGGTLRVSSRESRVLFGVP